MSSGQVPGFQRPLFSQQAPQISKLEGMMESMLMTQQKYDEYIKQLDSQIDVFTTHKEMLEAQISQQASSSSTPPNRPPGKPEPNLRDH